MAEGGTGMSKTLRQHQNNFRIKNKLHIKIFLAIPAMQGFCLEYPEIAYTFYMCLALKLFFDNSFSRNKTIAQNGIYRTNDFYSKEHFVL